MTRIRSDMAASVWKVEVVVGQNVALGDTLVILESMKMEIPIVAPHDGTVRTIDVAEGASISEGATLVVLDARAT